ncbi:uncharacterized protein [Haliotis cracherodii]|uniref:uncharacterized protein n=1 Tax=Haliotis cracherodii TaxID=6455 RepID=UPI0039EA9CE0
MLGSMLVTVFAAVHGVRVCDFGKYGQNCDLPCSEDCGLFLETNLRPCHKDTGKCLQGCVRGRHGDHCDQLCSQNCINTTCNQGNGGCTIGCIDGYIGYFCNTTDPTVQNSIVCDMGKYGQNCDRPCSEDCGLFLETKIRPCHKDTGKCLQGCVRGRHGDHCDQLCSQNCIKTTCNQRNGGCTIGCTDGYIGYFCNITTDPTVQNSIVCDMGKYGQNCDRPCSEDCGLFLETKIRPCHKDTGKCLQGCVRGRHGDHCDQLCSQNCIKTTCNQRNGGCTIGCTDGYIGYFCNITTGGGHIRHSMHWMWMLPVAVLIFSTMCCWKSQRCRRTFDKGFTWLIRRNPRSSSSDPSQDHSENEEDPLLSTASRATPSPTDLFFASEAGDFEVVRWLLSTAGVNVNCRLGSRTPVMEAAQWGHRDVVELLVKEGADVSLVDEFGDNTLHLACSRGDVETVEFVLSLNVVDINSRGGRSRTLVMKAAVGKHRDVVKLLVSNGADVSLVDVVGNNTLHWACRGGDVETVEFVLSLNVVDINSRGGRSRTPVMRAAFRGHRDVVKLLVSNGADVSLVDVVGNNTLHWACWSGDVETVEFVLSLNVVDIDARNNSGETAADRARLRGRQRVVELLKSHGAQ